MNIKKLKRTVGITLAMSMFAIPAFASPAPATSATNTSSSVSIDSANKELASQKVKPADTEKADIKLEARFFAPHIKAEAKTDSVKMATGNTIDFKNTLGLADENSPELKLSYNDVEFDYIHIHSGGNSDLSASPISFDNKTYNGAVETKTNFDYLGFKVNNTIHSDSISKLSWNYGLNAFRFDVSMKDSAKSDNKNLTAAVPTIGVSASTFVDQDQKLQFYGNVTGLPMGGYGHFYDVEAGFKYSPTNLVSVTAGYRAIDIKVSYNDDYANYKIDGPFAGLEFLF